LRLTYTRRYIAARSRSHDGNQLASESVMKTKLLIQLAAPLLLLGTLHFAHAQSAPGDMAASEPALNLSHSGNIAVYVRTEDGEPLSSAPTVTLTEISRDMPTPKAQKGPGDVWIFPNVLIGDLFEVQIQAPGYHTELRAVTVPDSANPSASIIVFMRSPNDELAFHPPSGQFVLPPQAEKEAQKGAEDLDSGKIQSAQKHLSKALEMAPGNPYVNYLEGMRFLLDGELPAAKPYLEKSVSMDARQVPALIALGSLRFQQGDYSGAIQVLAPAARLDASKWKVHSMLAGSYLKERDFAHSREQAEQALALGGIQAGHDELVLGEALAGLGEREKAVIALETFLKQYPHDGNSPAIRAWLPELKQPQVPNLPPVSLQVLADPSLDLPPREDWAPPDIDTQKPLIISGASCSLPKVLKAAAKNAAQLVTDLEKFSSTEEYQTVEIKQNKSLETPVSRRFNYMVFIEHPSAQVIQVNEFRDQGVTAKEMPGELADMGAPGLVLVFHPLLQGDFTWSCRGLGEWRDEPAWVVRFEQRPDRPNRLLEFQSSMGTYALPLKGLAWVSENGGQVIHMETDLAKPIPEIKLQREHFVIDYKSTAFPKSKVTLWLPEDVDVYFQYRGHYLHHYHHFSNFKLFSTSATQKIGQPKEVKNNNN
jgi:tetratricopeptide (TPR) repeat protein